MLDVGNKLRGKQKDGVGIMDDRCEFIFSVSSRKIVGGKSVSLTDSIAEERVLPIRHELLD